MVYNQVDPSLRNSYTRPAHMEDKTWKKVIVYTDATDHMMVSFSRYFVFHMT